MTISSRAGRSRRRRRPGPSPADPARALLACGVGYGVLYVVENDVIAARRYPGYSRVSQVVSELSAKGSPARPFLTATVPLSSALMAAFGTGVVKSAGGRGALRWTGRLLVGGSLLSFLWLPFPMSSREEIAGGHGGTNDIGHIVMSAATLAVVLSEMGTAARALGRPFRVYTAVSAATFLGFGIMTGVESRKIERGEPTPFLGLVERIMLGAWLLWMATLALALRRPR